MNIEKKFLQDRHSNQNRALALWLELAPVNSNTGDSFVGAFQRVSGLC